MRAIVLDMPGPANAFRIEERPVPEAVDGWTLLRVRAFGLNRSELHTRLGFAGDSVTFPRVLGIEATGEIESSPSRPELVGQKAVAMMGGMGRRFDGGYADYLLVPDSQVVTVDTELDWGRLGALPEVLQTAYGSLTVGTDCRAGSSLLVRGGTSSVGLMLALLGMLRGITVYATTRHRDRFDDLEALGAIPVLDDGNVANAVRRLEPEGVDGAIELVGAPTLQDTLRSCRRGGTTCFTGMLSNSWIVDEFYPIDFIPTGVRLTAYGGDASDLPSDVLAEVANAIHAGEVSFPTKTYRFEDIAQAHDDMEHNRVAAKQVVLTTNC